MIRPLLRLQLAQCLAHRALRQSRAIAEPDREVVPGDSRADLGFEDPAQEIVDAPAGERPQAQPARVSDEGQWIVGRKRVLAAELGELCLRAVRPLGVDGFAHQVAPEELRWPLPAQQPALGDRLNANDLVLPVDLDRPPGLAASTKLSA